MKPMKQMMILGLAATLAGCVEREAPAPMTEQDHHEISRAMAVVLERQLSPTNGMARTSGEIALGRAPAWLGQASGGLWLGELLGLHFALAVGCEDAGGGRVACGPGADAAGASIEVGGQLSLLGWTGSFDVSAEGRLSGLRAPVVTAELGAQLELGSRFVEWFRPVTHDARFSISASSRVDVDRATAIALAGGARFAIEYERTRSDTGEVARHALVIEVSIAAGFATFTLGHVTYRIDLRTGRIEEI
jgi:hypothetical protein